HTLHVYLLHAPDFLGYEGAVEMAADHPGVVERGLRLKKAGNAIMQILGGREIHPINVRLGGFYRVPRAREWDTLREELLWARDAAVETVRWTAGFDFPDLERDYELVALQSETEYPFNEGTIASNRGLAIDASEFEDHFEEQQVPHSNALHCVHREHGAYLVGPLARFALNAERLSPLAREVAREIGLETTCRNPFRSILVRGIEIVHACDEAVNILEAMPQPEEPAVEVPPVAGIGWAATEAPRGLLYHRYRTDEHGRIEEAHIVPPTSQNQKSIEDDLRDMIPGLLDADDALMRHRCEQAIRNYDPCISCATHFLRLEIERR
ncbi:MAG: nickel-dependent hydrogenase large subunit, partial [Planctomycetota bacterium]